MLSEVVMNSEVGGEDVVLTPESLLGVDASVGVGDETTMSLGRRLLVAARRGQASVVLELMQDGAPFASDWLGTSPLHLAAANGHLGTAAVLLRAGVSAEARTKVDRTPLHLAAYHGHAPVVALLLEHRAAPDVTDMLVMTPLHWAAERGHTEAARVLLAHGADPSRVSKFGVTPRHLALENQHHEIVALIDQAAAAANNNDQTEGMTTDEQQKQDALESLIPRVEEAHTEEVQHDSQHEETPEECESAEEGGGGESAAARLLRSHGIAVSDTAGEPGDTVRAALRAGRTLLLSDAAKRLLRDTAPAPPPPNPVLRVPEQFITSLDPEYLRSQLLQAHLSLARAQHKIKELEARLGE